MLLLLTLACGNPDLGPTSVFADAAAYAGPTGRRWWFAPVGTPAATPLIVEHQGDVWEVRRGARWRLAEPVATWQIASNDTLSLGGEDVLPADLTGATTGERSVWYGTFADTVTVTTDGALWTGEQVFALDFGPIVLSGAAVAEAGGSVELVAYEDPTAP